LLPFARARTAPFSVILEPVTRQEAKTLVAQWEKRKELLAQVRRSEIRAADTEHFIHSMSGILEALLPGLPVRMTSGLIEQQALFSKLRTGERSS
jgi:hypothetical protein